MKKLIAFITIIIAFNGISTYSEILQNTTWSMQDSTGKSYALLKFGIDTMSFKEDVEFYQVATFKVSGNNFSTIDLPKGQCSLDTGKYTYLIQNDTLRFTVISDVCSLRISTLVNLFFVRYQTGIENINNIPLIQLFPNPAADELIIKSNIDETGTIFNISDQLGRQILTGKLTGESLKVDINHLSSGLYFLQIGDKNKQTFKLIKK
jgi:hypothetical protein